MYPAKFTFNVNATPDCTNDFVVYGLNVAGTTGGQANLIALNNLYSGTGPTGFCGSAPTVYWAYNATNAGGRLRRRQCFQMTVPVPKSYMSRVNRGGLPTFTYWYG